MCYFGAMNIYDVVIIGAGPAGIMAAIRSSQRGFKTLLIDKNDQIGRKILATGNGRCNLTNKNITLDRYHGGEAVFIDYVLKRFDQEKTMDFFTSQGVLLKEEDRGRVFPRTNQAKTIVNCLEEALKHSGVATKRDFEVKKLTKEETFTIESTTSEKIYSKKVILATGGKAAHQLGSSGDGLYWSKNLGHSITPIHAALCPIELKESTKQIQGIKIETVMTSYNERGVLQKTTGDAIFTHFGISGPAVMAQSRVVSPALQAGIIQISLDLLPEMSHEELDKNLTKLLELNNKKSIKNVTSGLLTSGLVPVVLERSGVAENKKAAEISKKERLGLIETIKGLAFTVEKIRPLKEAQVTAGGIDLKEVNPETLESKIVEGLYFAGEILDVDADSGGFNLQWAWSSGYLAGSSV